MSGAMRIHSEGGVVMEEPIDGSSFGDERKSLQPSGPYKHPAASESAPANGVFF